MIGNFRLQKILEVFLETNKVVTGKQLCTMLGVSSRTIRSDIKELNDILENKGAIISSKKSIGYKIEIFDEERFNKFLKTIDRNENDSDTEVRAEYVIIRLLINELKGIEGITQIELADELYVSISSIKNDIKLAKNILLKFELDIEKIGNKGLKISGDEECIRCCINRYMFSNNDLLKDTLNSLFKEIVCDKNELFVDEIVKQNISKFKLRFSDIAYRDIISYIKIILIRNYENKTINYDKDTIEKLKNEPKFKMAQSISDDIEKIVGTKILENEVLYLTKHIVASSSIGINKDIEISTLEKQNKILIEILSSINNIFNIDFTKDNILINFLGSHLKASINRAKYGIKIENSMLSLIKNNYPFALEFAVLANSIIKREEGFNLTEDDIGFIALHFAAALERIKYKNKTAIKNAIIVCTTGVGTSLLLKVRLKSYFKDRLNIVDTIPWYEFNDNVLSKVDLIISTIPLESKCDKVIHIKRLLDNEEIKLLEDKLYNNHPNKNGLVTKFNEKLFFVDVEVSDRDSLLNFMTNKLIKNNYINENVKRDIFKREKLAATEIGNLVAIPHAMHKDIEEFFVSVAILKKPIDWDKEKVQLVLLIGMANSYNQNWKLYLEQLYKNIIDLEVVQKMIKVHTFEDLKKIISKF
ncbi:BglG family transcription antiterminator [Clostridium sp. MB40-C1]|uniref:BglG family transcription antiterminator n=1 Tax=Clostridium sp. MB40-C1 TaxID=3070996 RepID=UPI0027DEBF00|nr:BglG family transcription antiterminator [Clostridium sp. MB40-C1]WMJ81698.1 BglG family transcription antiterminator [Clostridium sp. MB40-C1]